MARAAIAWDSRLPGGLAAHVDHGRVTLDGLVSSDAEREAAFEDVAHLRGVRGVKDASMAQRRCGGRFHASLQRNARA